MVLHMEDYTENRAETMLKVYDFLTLGKKTGFLTGKTSIRFQTGNVVSHMNHVNSDSPQSGILLMYINTKSQARI